MSQPTISMDFLRPEDYSNIAAIETAIGIDPIAQQTLANRLKNVHTIGHKAVIGGQLAGYVIYERDEEHHQNSVIKFVVNPEFRDRAEDIRELMLETVRHDMTTQGRSHIVIYTSAADEDTLAFFAARHKEYRNYKANGTDDIMLIYDLPTLAAGASQQNGSDVQSPPGFYNQSFVSMPPMDGISFSMDTGIPNGYGFGDTGYNAMQTPNPSFGSNDASDISITSGTQAQDDEFGLYQQDDNLPTLPKFKPMSRSAAIQRGKEKLTEITGMEWEAVTLSPRGKFDRLNISPNTALPDDIYFQTASKVANPRQALDALYTFLGQPGAKLHSAHLDKAMQLTIPASMVRPIHLALGKPAMLKECFKPASLQMRYQWSDETTEPKRQVRR